MELRRLRYFVVVAEELSFTRAAARLQMAQPPLSQQVAKLERELKLQLFDRTAQGIRLTQAGTTLLGEARVLLARADEVWQATRDVAEGAAGTLRVGCVPSGFLGLLPSVLPAFRDRTRSVRPLLYQMGTSSQLRALQRGHIDLGVIRLPPASPRLHASSDLVVEALAGEPLRVALPAGHRLAGETEVPLGALTDEPFVTFPRRIAPEHFDALLAHCMAAGFSPHIVAEVRTDDAMLGLVAAGTGVSLIPDATTNLCMRGVAYRPLAPPTPLSTLALVWPAEGDTPLVRSFVDTAREVRAGSG